MRMQGCFIGCVKKTNSKWAIADFCLPNSFSLSSYVVSEVGLIIEGY